MAAKRNPNAPEGALTVNDLRSDMEVVWHVVVAKEPYESRLTIIDIHAEDANRPDRHITVRFADGDARMLRLADLGISPGSFGGWSQNYTMPA